MKRLLLLLIAAFMAASIPVSVGLCQGPSAFASDQVIVKFAPSASQSARQSAAGRHGLSLLGAGPHDSFHVFRLPRGKTVEAVVAALSRNREVVYAEPNYIATVCVVSDPLYRPYQWNMYNRGAASGRSVSNWGVQAEAAWAAFPNALVPGAEGNVTVAILDTGVAYESYGTKFARAPDLAGVVFVSPRNLVSNSYHANDDHGHGTHVCGTIAQATNNRLGAIGLFPGVRIMPVKVLDRAGSGQYSWIAAGIYWAADHGAKVINMSLAGPSDDRTLRDAVAYAAEKDVVIVAAAGNGGAARVDYPAAYGQCIAVGATRFDGRKPSYSNYGSAVAVLAPGGDTSVDQNGDGRADGIIQQTFLKNQPKKFGYYFYQGTSMAAPHVTAVAALVRSRSPLNALETRNIITMTAVPDPLWPGSGLGVVDAAAAVSWQ